ncbi:BolA family protein [Azomonas macrocytogenes]|uniref:BolA protein n=1 Tax=Azomonas macrocytogenes TaxID=69962 RepID=A0A839T3K1_AZOMA|nr:BolA family protein [Azomonas macrocytogenes]MBB3104111.1 BolA protein [Azomonas macrocytogenes]
MSRQEQIVSALQNLQPLHLDVLNESHMHKHGNESHYKAIVVSEEFAGLSAVKRHQKVYAVLGDMMGQLRALALHTYTPGEWTEKQGVPASPNCAGVGH